MRKLHSLLLTSSINLYEKNSIRQHVEKANPPRSFENKTGISLLLYFIYMKQLFTIIKTWYTCTNEQFSLIVIEWEKTDTILFEWLYWAEERLASIMKEKWFSQFYSYANYGRITKKDIRKNTLSEYQAIEYIKTEYSFLTLY